jgi:hypothetical protein
LSELALLKKLKTLVAQQAPAASPQSIRFKAPAAGQQQQEDVLRVYARMNGLTDDDIQYCYETSDSYSWCLALTGSGAPPASPPSDKLDKLIVKLIALGKLTPERITSLGLADRVKQIIASMLGGAIAGLMSEPENPVKQVSVEHVLRDLQKLYAQAFGRAPLESTEKDILDLLSKRYKVPAGSEATIIKLLRGSESPQRTVEQLISVIKHGETGGELSKEQALSRKGAPVSETAVGSLTPGKSSAPAGEGFQGRSQAPKGEY